MKGAFGLCTPESAPEWPSAWPVYTPQFQNGCARRCFMVFLTLDEDFDTPARYPYFANWRD